MILLSQVAMRRQMKPEEVKTLKFLYRCGWLRPL